ncbi:MAG TPA: 6-hydroxymethylpterin diphosphokinase MptE-like protein, partial [Tepidisphaeraceae bacterium]|nr:6-hydroxymethylpterin diphosphokinase MptE-like protein [Tepidisphaeraceae bacterium]
MTAIADPSARFVLPSDAPYLRNLAALWSVNATLAAEIEALEGQPSYAVEPSKSGTPTMIVPTRDGRRVHLHSKHRPIDEAKRLVDPIDAQQGVFFNIHGLGLGYTLELLFDRAGDEAVFCVFEPDLLLIRTALETRDLSRVIDSRRVHFFWQADKSDLFVRLMPQTPMVTLGMHEVLHAASIQRDSEFHEQMQAWLAEFASFCKTNMNTLVMNGRRTLENIARNLGWYTATACPSRLKDRYKDKPALIVSAGPSLRKNKHLIQQMVGKSAIIAVQTTLQPLLEMGVEPDFVTALDYHDICTRFFEKLPKGIKTELVAEPKATNLIFSLNPGPLTVIGNDTAESLLREMRLNKTGLPSGSTVAHLAYYLAEHLGCNPIIFVGQDLGFSDGLYYSPGTSYEDVWRPELGRFCTIEMKQWEQIVRERHILRRVPDHEGRPTYTEERLFTYLQQFERDFLSTKTKVIDSTEGGVLKRGAESMPFARAIAQYITEGAGVIERPSD